MSYGKQLAALHGAVVGRGLDAALPLTHDARADVFPPQARLMVYAGGYVQRLSGATLADFPGFAALVGEAQAVQLAQAFAQETPSQHYDLNLYPVQFADYLRGRVDGDAQAVAALEAAIAEVFWLPESAALDAQSLAGLDEEGLGHMRLQLRAAARLLKLDYAVNDWLARHRAGTTQGAPEHGETHLLVLRHRNEVRRHSLHALEYALLKQLEHGGTLAQALEGASEDMAQLLPGFLGRWLTEGFLSAA